MPDVTPTNSAARRYSPKEFLRGRRPKQFSDTVAAEHPQLDRALLEYHLDTLTSRSQENDFEAFCRRLAEHEICPNLVPHTGPTGGGDSKVDSENYPVADVLADNWYTGLGREAATERWAFAISAKKDWRPKVQSDVAKIAATDRGYTNVFFFSSRFIPDKARAEVEDKLTQEHKMQVRIFDRTWLLDKVFQNRHEALAIETLRMQVATLSQSQPGPQDAQRLPRLQAAQDRIREDISQQRYSTALVDDCLDAAILARQLERPYDETDGLFMRACRLAAKYGTTQQRITCLYQRAWTSYWWHEDWELFAELYDQVEAAVIGSHNAFDVERLQNLWTLYNTAVRHQDIKAGTGELAQKTATLRAEQIRLSKETHRPSTALQARLHLLVLDLTQVVEEQRLADARPVFEQMREVVRQSQGLVGFVLNPLMEILSSMGPLFLDVSAYDDLFDELVVVSASRESEVVAAKLLVSRGAQLSDGGRPAEAIKKFGNALGKLYKHESREEVVVALAMCGVSYTAVGLSWAARNSTLFAASLATDEFYRYGETTAAQVTCFYRLSWLELQLGRICLALAWYELYLTIGRVLLSKREYKPKKFARQCLRFDTVLGKLLLDTKVADLAALSLLLAALDRLELFNASLAALYALGYEEEIVQQEPFNQEPEKLSAFFENWRDLRVEGQLPEALDFYEGTTVKLQSIVLGCQVQVTATNELAVILLAESLVAGFESLLATSLATKLVLKEPQLTLEVRRDEAETSLIAHELSERDGRPYLVVRCGTLTANLSSLTAQAELKKQIGELLLTMLAGVVMPVDLSTYLTTLFRDESAISRAVDFNNSFILTTNLLGDAPKYKLTDWAVETESRRPPQRTQAWYEALPLRPLTSEPPTEPPVAAPERSIRHNQVAINSLIRDPLWDRAKWVGVGFVQFPHVPCPALCLLFSNKEEAIRIFELWRQELTARDASDQLRIALIRRFDQRRPLAYRVVVGSNIGPLAAASAPRPTSFDGYMVTAHRIHEMDNPTVNHVDPFRQAYEKQKTYLLVPGVYSGSSTPPQFFPELGILKHQLAIRDAWEVGINDLDSAGIKSGDDPWVPANTPEPPVHKLLKLKRSRQNTGGHNE